MEIKNQNELKKKRLRQKNLMKCKKDYCLTRDVYNNLNNNEFKTTVKN